MNIKEWFKKIETSDSRKGFMLSVTIDDFVFKVKKWVDKIKRKKR